MTEPRPWNSLGCALSMVSVCGLIVSCVLVIWCYVADEIPKAIFWLLVAVLCQRWHVGLDSMLPEPVPAPQSSASLETRVRELLARGDKIDALRLIRTEKGISLDEAKEYAEQAQPGKD